MQTVGGAWGWGDHCCPWHTDPATPCLSMGICCCYYSGGVDECGSRVSKDRQERLWIHISNIWIYLLSPVGRSVCPSSSLLLLFRSVLLQCDSEIQGDHMEVEIP